MHRIRGTDYRKQLNLEQLNEPATNAWYGLD